MPVIYFYHIVIVKTNLELGILGNLASNMYVYMIQEER